MKPVFHLYRKLAWKSVVSAPEGVAVIQKEAVIRQVERAELNRPFLADRFPQRQVESGMRGKVGGAVSIQKPGAVLDIPRGPGSPRQIYLESSVEGIALIVVQEKIVPILGGREIRKSAGYTAPALGVLMRVGEVELGSTKQ